MRKSLAKLAAALALIVAPIFSGVAAGCPMCRQTVEAATDAGSVGGGLNLAILILLAPPLVIFVGIFGALYRQRDRTGD